MLASPLCGRIIVFEFYPRKNRCKIVWSHLGCSYGCPLAASWVAVGLLAALGCLFWVPWASLAVNLGGYWVGCLMGISLVAPGLLLVACWHPGRPLGTSQVLPGCLLGASWASSGGLLAFWVSPRCPLGVSWVSPGCSISEIYA